METIILLAQMIGCIIFALMWLYVSALVAPSADYDPDIPEHFNKRREKCHERCHKEMLLCYRFIVVVSVMTIGLIIITN